MFKQNFSDISVSILTRVCQSSVTRLSVGVNVSTLQYTHSGAHYKHTAQLSQTSTAKYTHIKF